MSGAKELDFGDYCYIEQKRYGVPNERYKHKVINNLRSNGYVDVPVQSPARETLHTGVVPVVSCICCGVSEREVLHYRVCDVAPQNTIEGVPVQTPNTQSHAISLCLGCIKEPCSQRSELPSCPVTICAMRQAKHAGV